MLGRYSAVEVGRAFEFHCVRYLNTQLHMSLIRTGKAGDEGIDVQGSWYLPAVGDAPESSTAAAVRRMKVVGQCKALAKPLGGIAIRELEGVLGHLRDRSTSPISGRSASPNAPQTHAQPLGVLCSQSGFSQAAMARALRSPSPLLLLSLPGGRPREYDEEGNSMSPDYADGDSPDLNSGQGFSGLEPAGVFWNPTLSEGILRGQVELRREILGLRPSERPGQEPVEILRFGLWKDGKRLGRLGADE